MNTPLCRLRERTLARLAALGAEPAAGSRLSRHLQTCADCRAFWQDARRLTSDLPAALPSLPAPEATAFLNSVWTKAAQAERQAVLSRPSRLPTLIVVGAVAATVLLLVTLWHTPSPKPAPGEVAELSLFPRPTSGKGRPLTVKARNPIPQPPRKHAPAVVSIHPKRNPSAGTGRRTLAERETPAVRSPRRHSPGTSRVAQRPALRPERTVVSTSAQKIAALMKRPEYWARWGDWYAAQGDHERAAAAYQRACNLRPEPRYLFAAGQSAEASGDVTKALYAYTRLIAPSPASETPNPEADAPPQEKPEWNDAPLSL